MVRRLRIETILRVVVALAAVVGGAAILFAAPAPAEPPGCANNTCKQIVYYWDCVNQIGNANDNPDCLYCASANGRCDSGSGTSTCTKTTQPLRIARANVKNVCYCPPVPGVPAGTTTVEATGAATGDFQDSGSPRYTCQ